MEKGEKIHLSCLTTGCCHLNTGQKEKKAPVFKWIHQNLQGEQTIIILSFYSLPLRKKAAHTII